MSGPPRVPHIIRPNHRSSAPNAYVVFAITTNEVPLDEKRIQHTAREIAAIYWRPERRTKDEILDYRTFGDVEGLCAYLAASIHSKERLAIVAYDMDFVAQVCDIHCRLREINYHPTRIVIEKGKWQQRWRENDGDGYHGSRSMLWLDLRNFYPTTLRQLANWLAIPYPKQAEDGESWLHDLDGARWRAIVTLRGVQIWLDFLKRHNLGYFSATLAGQAFNAYRHRFMSFPIYVHVHHDVIEIEKEANFGARIEARFKGRAPKDDYVQVDATSFYASVMRGNRYPTKQIGHTKRIGLGKLADLLKRYAVVARCTIQTESPRYPKREGDSVIYPVGRFETTLTTPEIKDALGSGEIAAVSEAVVYEQEPIFDEFVEFFWNMRLQAKRVGDKLSEELAKRFLTAVFGKFGQRVWLAQLIREDAVGHDRIWREFDWQDGMEYEYRIIAGRMERAIREMLGRDTLLAIPAHVTAYARSRLWRLMEKAGREHIYYVDTDSFVGRKLILGRIGDEFGNKTLGGLRLVKTSSHLFIRAPKWYVFGDTTKRAGIPLAAYETAWNVFEGEENRSMHWALSHDSQCTAIVERIRVTGPLTDRLSLQTLGSFSVPPRYGESPLSLGHGLVQPQLPLLHSATPQR